MFCVLYKVAVKPDHEDQFRQHWVAVTKYLYQGGGSLGSRLRRVSTGDYIGYAQWTSRERWQGQVVVSPDPELKQHQQAMRKCCERIEILYELEMTDDWLQGDVYGG